MSDMPEKKSLEIAVDALKTENERLKWEVLLERQKTDFDHLLSQHRDEQAKALAEHKQDVHYQINKRLVALTVIGVGLILVAWWRTTEDVRQFVKNRLDQEFASENIKALISEAALRAADSQSRELMEGVLKPAINEARREIAHVSKELKDFADQSRRDSKQELDQIRQDFTSGQADVRKSMVALRDDYKKELNKLATEVDYQKQLREIHKLRTDAMEGSYAAYVQLEALGKTKNPDLALVAQIAALEAKGFYIGKTRIKGVSLGKLNGPKNEKLSTPELLDPLLDGRIQWRLRARAAELLASRKEIGVAEALLRAMTNDPNLWVRREALQSFSGLTNFTENDAFDFARAASWWEENKGKYLETLKK